jgi:hypothetical protein
MAIRSGTHLERVGDVKGVMVEAVTLNGFVRLRNVIEVNRKRYEVRLTKGNI